MIPWLGVPGLILAVSLGPAASLVYGLRRVKKNHGFTLDYRAAFKALLATMISLTATILVSAQVLHPWATILVGGATCMATYMASIIVFKALTRKDLDNLTELATGLGPLAHPIKRGIGLLRRVT